MRAAPFKRTVGVLALVVGGAVTAGACTASSATATDRLAAGPGAVTTVTTPRSSGRTAPPPTVVTDSADARGNGGNGGNAGKRSNVSESSSTSTSTTTTAKPRPMDDQQLSAGEQGPEIALLQMRLIELGYRPGTPDGSYGAATSSAVMAFQKREGLARDGTAGAAVLERLAAPSGAGPHDARGGPRIEVDLDRQVAFVIVGGTVSTISISSGNNQTYTMPDTNKTAVAYTPTGSYKVGLRIDGPENGKLGVLYRPLYFTGGWAVHGSTSVPAYPASHGCVRTSYADQDWLFDQFPSGAAVVVYKNGSAAPTAIGAGDSPGG